MSNPYQPPAFDPKKFQDVPQNSPVSAGDYGWINQVRIFAILNGVQGVLEIPMGCMTLAMSVLFPTIMRMEGQRPGQNAADKPPEEMIWFLTIFYAAIGLPVLISGFLRIWAAFQNYRFRGRTLGIVSISLGMFSLLSCYCAPTSIALLVYGLILFFQPAVKSAFAMGSQGTPADQVLAAFMPYRPGPYAPPPPPL